MAITEAQRSAVLALSGEARQASLYTANASFIDLNSRVTRLEAAGGIPSTLVSAWKAFWSRWVTWASNGANGNTQLLAFLEDAEDWRDRIRGLEEDLPSGTSNPPRPGQSVVVPSGGGLLDLNAPGVAASNSYGWVVGVAAAGLLGYLAYRALGRGRGRRLAF